MTFITHSRVIQHYTSREYVIEEPISDLYITLESDKNDILFSGSRDGTLKRWELADETAT